MFQQFTPNDGIRSIDIDSCLVRFRAVPTAGNDDRHDDDQQPLPLHLKIDIYSAMAA